MTAQAACTGGSDSTRLKAAGQGTRGAHFEHAAHGCDARRVEAERLVERRRVLPSRKAGMRRGTRYGPGGVRASDMHEERVRLKALGAQGMRGAHGEHLAHVRDLGRVEAERLVERRRGLPSRKAGMRCGKRYSAREGIGWRRRKRHARGGADSRLWSSGHAGSTRRTWCPCP